MVQVTVLRRRSWAGAAWLLLIAAGMLVALALGNIIVLFATLAVATVAGLLLLRDQSPAIVSSQPAATNVAGVARVQRGVTAADGTARQALVVQAATVDGYQAVLTIDGYALVNAEGRVVYALNRAAPVDMREPVLVTIVDAESVTR